MGHVPRASRLGGASRPPPPKKNEEEEGEEEEKKKNKKKNKADYTAQDAPSMRSFHLWK